MSLIALWAPWPIRLADAAAFAARRYRGGRIIGALPGDLLAKGERHYFASHILQNTEVLARVGRVSGPLGMAWTFGDLSVPDTSEIEQDGAAARLRSTRFTGLRVRRAELRGYIATMDRLERRLAWVDYREAPSTKPDLWDWDDIADHLSAETGRKVGVNDLLFAPCGGDDDGSDVGVAYDFRIRPNVIPEGKSYEWKRVSVRGAVDHLHWRDLWENGWRPVPSERHREMRSDTTDGTIKRSGMILMERPQPMTDEARREDFEIAVGQVARRKDVHPEPLDLGGCMAPD